MTTQFTSSIFGMIVSFVIVSSSFAQHSDIASVQRHLNKNTYKVYDNVASSFRKLFANAENVQWEKLNDKFLAKFSIEGLEYRALMNAKGQLIYKNTYGTEQQLPVDIRKNVKRNYVEFIITSVVHVEEARRSIWVINLADDKSYVTIRVENNEIEEIGKYKKSK